MQPASWAAMGLQLLPFDHELTFTEPPEPPENHEQVRKVTNECQIGQDPLSRTHSV